MSIESSASAHNLASYGRLLRRRWKHLALIIPAVMLLAVFLAYALPVSYQSTGTIMLEPPDLPATMVPSTIVTPKDDAPGHAAQQLELTRRKVMTHESLVALVKSVDPYPNERGMSKNDKATRLEEDTSLEHVDPITFKPLEDSDAFSIHYNNPDPDMAARIATRLVDLFLTYNRRTRAELAAQAYRFLQAQAHDLEGSMADMEHKLAQFKARYGEALPTAQQRNESGVDRSQRDVEDFQRQILLAEQQESLLSLQLSNLSPNLTASVGDWREELAKTRGELAEAEQRYTPEHPDVKRLKRAVADLVAMGRASEAVSSAKADNPEYLTVKSQLDSTRQQLASLRAFASHAQSNLSTYERNIATAPNVEREYTQISRDYDNARARYEDLQTKMKSAALSQSLENQARGERFTLMRPPAVPIKPYFPNRLGIVLLGLVLGIGLAVGVAVLVDASDPTVRSCDDLQDILEVTPVGAIPVLLNREDLHRRRRRWISVTAAYAAAAAVVAITAMFAK